MSNYTDFSVKWKFDLVQFCFHKTDILDIKRIIVPEMYVQEVRRLLYDYLELRGMEYERGVLFYIPIEAGTLPIEIGGALQRVLSLKSDCATALSIWRIKRSAFAKQSPR